MITTEVDTLVRKFHQLWNDGFTAHLDLDTHAGDAWVGLRLNLGQIPGPIHGHGHAPPSRHFGIYDYLPTSMTESCSHS